MIEKKNIHIIFIKKLKLKSKLIHYIKSPPDYDIRIIK